MAFYRNRLPKKEGEKAAQYHGSVFFFPLRVCVPNARVEAIFPSRPTTLLFFSHSLFLYSHTRRERETCHALGGGKSEITRMLPLLRQGKSSHVVVGEVGWGGRGKRDLLCPVFRNPSSSSSSSFHGVAGGPRGMGEGKLRTSPGYGARNGEGGVSAPPKNPSLART